MKNVAVVAVALVAAAFVGTAQGMGVPAAGSIAGGNFGSYLVVCTETNVIFMDWASQECQGTNYTTANFNLTAGFCGTADIGFPYSWNSMCNSTTMWFNNFATDTCHGESFLSRYYTTGKCHNCPNKECKNP